ncbi:hypothetical protein GCM10010195_73390 [Kitasatospora griseola]|nr:hypothetical protein GCM10010195_73390 [Kitasatospora griseola]
MPGSFDSRRVRAVVPLRRVRTGRVSPRRTSGVRSAAAVRGSVGARFLRRTAAGARNALGGTSQRIGFSK